MTITERPLSTSEVQALSLPLQNDLTAIFGVIGDEADRLLDKAVTEGWTPDELIDAIVRMIGGDNRATETVAVGPLQNLSVNKAYKLDGRMTFQGMPISIENAKGSTRSGIDKDGHPWSITMLRPYGYIKGTEGVDGDAVDVYIGDNLLSQLVFIVHTKNPDGSYDEDKCMIGFNSVEEARQCIEVHYDRDIILNIDTLNIEQFKKYIEDKPGKKIKGSVRSRIEILQDVKKNLEALAVERGKRYARI
jgi:hypothetical protein